MLFNSWHFVIFFPLVFALYWMLPHKCRKWLLLIASYYFYMSWNVKYVVLILFTTIVSYAAGILIAQSTTLRVKKYILTLSVIACLGVLFMFKYVNFMTGAVIDLLNMFALHLHPMTLKLLLPVGISFYTFQTLGYVIDVYRGTEQPERNFVEYAVFISYFPQLVAGPIERTKTLLPQIKAMHEFKYEQGVYGIKLMTWGFFKKLCIADVLGEYVDKVFADVYSYEGIALMLTILFFSLQIYCDFSGYSDIARGCSKMLGIDLQENFRSPYFSGSLREYWSRWHISLSTWFRDYVYIPLGGNRAGKLRQKVNLMLTFMISGLWHGADWTYLVWGIYHGLLQVIETALTGRKQQEVHGLKWAVRVLMTFMIVMLGWVLFRSQSLSEAMYIYGNMFLAVKGGTLGMNNSAKAAVTLSIIVLFLYDYISLKYDIIKYSSSASLYVRWAGYIVLGLMIIFFSPKDIAEDFIYFQF